MILIRIDYPNSLLSPLAGVVAAFPPPYLDKKSSLMRSKKAMGTCRPTDSSATIQYAATLKNSVNLLNLIRR
jgi:hypothetical protein